VRRGVAYVSGRAIQGRCSRNGHGPECHETQLGRILRTHKQSTFWVYALFFVSGVAALIFETLFFRQAGIVLGNSVWASALVLASFMGGLGVGNGLMALFGGRVRRPIRLYASLEVAIGVTALLLVWMLPNLTLLLAPLLRPLTPDPWVINAARFMLSFGLILIPAAAMGATLPLLTQALSRSDPDYGSVLGRLYGWNTLGAVIGAIGTEAFLVSRLGILQAGLVAVALNGLAAAGAFAFARRFEGFPSDQSAPPASAPRIGATARRLLYATALSGTILLALEVVWFRFLKLFVVSTSLAFAVILAVVLAGIGVGGIASARWLRNRSDAATYIPVVALAAGVATMLLYAAFDLVLQGVRVGAGAGAADAVRVGAVADVAFLGACLMFPTSLLSGMLFPLIGSALHEEISNASWATGLLTLANSIGSMLGALLAGFVQLPTLGIEASLWGLSVAYVIVAAIALVARRPAWAWKPVAVTLASLVTIVMTALLFPFGRMEARYALDAARPYESTGEKVIAIRESATETALYLERRKLDRAVEHRLITDGFPMAATSHMARRYMNLFVYWPVALHPQLKSALLISFGMGSTARALAETRSLERIDIVDISRSVLELSRLADPSPGRSPLDDPRVHVHIEDGRFFLQTTDQRFDLITAEPPPPRNAGIANLYSSEYFELIRDRLNEGGIATYWLPIHQLMQQPQSMAIVSAFCQAFPDCSLWNGAGFDWMLVGTRDARGPVSESQFRRQWDDATVASELRGVGIEVPEQLGALFLADADDLAEFARGISPLVDDRPYQHWGKPGGAAVGRQYHLSLMDVDAARERFARSPLIARLWPPGLRERSLAYFSDQQLLNRLTFASSNAGPIVDEFELQRLLTKSSLRAPVLWILNTSEREQQIAEELYGAGERSAELEWLMAVGALADRAYDKSAAHLERAHREAPQLRRVLMWRIFVLAMAGQFDAAQQVAAELAVTSGSAESLADYWNRMEKLFGIEPPRSAAR